MDFNTPDLKQIIEQMNADAEGRLPGVQPRLRRKLITAVINSAAAGIFGLYGVQQKLIDYILPDTCPLFILLRWVAIFLKGGRKVATAASGSIDFTGTDGIDIAAGTTIQRLDGVEYTTDVMATIVSGTTNVTITAVNTDADSNALTGVTLTLTTPIAGINSDAIVDPNGITGGADIEGVEPLRSRLLDVLRNPPQGGNANDYKVWAREVVGVTRAWSYPLEGGSGNIAVRFMMDDSYVDGVPQAGDVTAVTTHIEALYPSGAILGVVAPVKKVLNYTISISPDTQEIRDAVEAELKDMMLRDSKPGGTILISRINEVISLAEGEDDHTVTVPANNVVHTTNEIATMGAVTWN